MSLKFPITVGEIDGDFGFVAAPIPAKSFPRPTMAPPTKPVPPTNALDLSKDYRVLYINGYAYIVSSNLPIQQCYDMLTAAGYKITNKDLVIPGTELKTFPNNARYSSHDIFDVTSIYNFNNNIVRYSAALENMLVTGKVDAPPELHVTTVDRGEQQAPDGSKVKIGKDGNYVVTSSPKTAMYLSWDGDKFAVSINKNNPTDIKVEGHIQDGNFVCKYGKMAIN